MIALSFIFFFLALGISALAVWVYALIDIIKDDYKSDTDKIVWFLLVFFLPFLGTIIYFFVGREEISSLAPIDKTTISEEEYV